MSIFKFTSALVLGGSAFTAFAQDIGTPGFLIDPSNCVVSGPGFSDRLVWTPKYGRRADGSYGLLRIEVVSEGTGLRATIPLEGLSYGQDRQTVSLRAKPVVVPSPEYASASILFELPASANTVTRERVGSVLVPSKSGLVRMTLTCKSALN